MRLHHFYRATATTLSLAAVPLHHRTATALSTTAASPPRHVLLVASRADKASLNLAEAMLQCAPASATSAACWTPLEPCGNGERSRYISGSWAGGAASGSSEESNKVSLWLLSDKLTQFDDADKRWREENPDDGAVDEVIFLSRHAAESGRPCLTVHPIGTPSTARADPERFGGRPGRCPPPNLRMASLLRRVKAHAESTGLLLTKKKGGGGGKEKKEENEEEEEEENEGFEVSPEATHHGPWLEVPACFVEIGSREGDWGRKDASSVWAQVLHEELFGAAERGRVGGGGGGEAASSDSGDGGGDDQGVVVMGLGGGHYCPKISDIIGGDEAVSVGHIVPSYALAFDEGDGGGGGGGDWEAAVREAVASTRVAMESHGWGRRELVALVDKKAFKSTQKAMLTGLLEELDVRVAMKKNAVLRR